MWFKNLSVFRLLEPLKIDGPQVEESLQALVYQSCGAMEAFTLGWVPPLGERHVALSHWSEGRVIFTLQREDKVLPASTVRDRVQEKIERLYEQEGRTVGRKARETLRDEVLLDMLPRAFSQKQKISGYLDTEQGWLVVDTVSAKKAEDFVASLRKCLGGFPVKPFSTERRPSEVMTEWLRTGEPPSNLTIESECELKSEEKEGSVIRCQRQELISPEMKLHLDAGKQVTKLALSFEDRLGFVLGDDWVIRKLKFLDLIQEEAAQVDEGSDEAQFDADFALMSREINRMIQSLVPLFGGASQ